MLSEHDRHLMLELGQNIDALDPESIVPWSREIDENDTLVRRDRIGEAWYLAATLLAHIKEDGGRNDALTFIEKDLGSDLMVANITIGIEQQTRAKVRKQWTHSS
jgi:hypothetical protein